MGNFFFGLLEIIASIAILKYRRNIGDMIGEAQWMMRIGGIYNVIALAGALLCFLGFLTMFNLSGFFIGIIFSPLRTFTGAG